ncbi:isoprenylcysteine carboxylmethyltransferase family protein [Aestuariivirga litoralis]|uniref:Isoprenylcysteine carboxylmethyltransferase family protein n=1 Tax=Aestuariivirga litoralis TaxID=2650924 RepID=A0A2W2BLE7_9HYPH|nr:isoprenylcysteine carboxylmethyltransferase family protein [Aestuariivirga litoralis]PZF77089.1 isoprenylcysteine carboxylmethyltransferase family protein [Aestuariivirga litoralis]
MPDLAETPNTIPWPPLLFAGATILALWLQHVVPLPWPGGAWAAVLAMAGVFLAAAGIALDLATMLAFRRHRTTVLPNRGATRLITDGPFRFSRNPIYVGNTLLVAGAGLAFGIAWLVPAALAAAFATRKLAIEREERHLALRFGQEWTTYAARTPRWLI